MSVTENPFTTDWFQSYEEAANTSAQVIMPLVLELYQPTSVVDVGCGIGSFLAVCDSYGIDDILGIDGDYVDRTILRIPKDKFIGHDLEKPLEVDRRFDLVICLEVADDLPQEFAGSFVESLTNLGPVVLFSSAIPYQGGQKQQNEQWPDYWASLFSAHGYEAVDCLRKKIWANPMVRHWYAQNLLLFVQKDILESNSLLKSEYANSSISQLSLVHPKFYLHRCMEVERFQDPKSLGFKTALVSALYLPYLFFRAVVGRVVKFRSRHTH